MKVIMLEKIGKLGNIGDVANVKAGYARNYLLPYGHAIAANKANLEAFEARRAEVEAAAAERLAGAEARAEKLTDLVVTITTNAGEEGKLFGSIGTRDIADAITAAGVEVAKSEVKMPEGVIREVGEYEISVQMHSEVITAVKVVVEAE